MRKTGLLLLLLTLPALTAAARPALSAHITAPPVLDDQFRAVWRLTLSNSSAAAMEVPFSLSVYINNVAQPFLSFPDGAGCTIAYAGLAQCTAGVPANGSRVLEFPLQHSTRYGRASVLLGATSPVENIDVHEWEYAVFGRPYLVTNTDDTGPGSLRQAILDVNRDCTGQEPCAIEFAIAAPVPAEGWFTIAPRFPLPAVTSYDMILDGGSQTRFSGDTNPLGPEIVLDGSLSELPAAQSDGLTFHGVFNACRDLVIGGFPGNGINSSTLASLVVRDAYIGVDPTGRKAMANGRRGVKVSAGGLSLTHSVLSGNARAGAYIVTNDSVDVRGNLIGVGADGITPIGNGASGLFFHKTVIDYHIAGASENVIAHNAQAGIALSLAAVGNFAENDFHDNGGQAIDVGIDGPTSARNGFLGQGGVLGAPAILSAHYENGVTTIRASFSGGSNGSRVYTYVELYASHRLDGAGDPEGEEWLGRVETHGLDEVELKVNGDLRGRYVSASLFGYYAYNFEDAAPATSELGPARLVD